MAVALRLLPEFNTGYDPGYLSFMFGEKNGQEAANSTPFLQVVSPSPDPNDPRADAKGASLDTVDRVAQYLTGGQQKEHEQALFSTTFGYNDKELATEPTGRPGPGNNDPDSVTEIGRLKPFASNVGFTQSEELRKNQDFGYFMLLQSLSEDGEYLRKLREDLAAIDARLKELREEITAREESQDLLNDVNTGNLNTPATRLRLARSLRRHGLDLNDFLDADGNVDRDKLNQALRDQATQQAREEQDLLDQREELSQALEKRQQAQQPTREEAAKAITQITGVDEKTAAKIAADTTGEAFLNNVFEEDKPPATQFIMAPAPVVTTSDSLTILNPLARGGSAASLYDEESPFIMSDINVKAAFSAATNPSTAPTIFTAPEFNAPVVAVENRNMSMRVG